MYLCEACGRRVRPASEEGIVFAVLPVKAKSVGPTAESREWLGGFFHDRCFSPGSTQWRRWPMPAGIDDGEGES